MLRDADKDLPKFNPTDKQTIRPGPAVDAIASMSSNLTPLSLIAFFAIKSIFSRCDLAASSGTTPPNSLCTSIWLEMIFAKISTLPSVFSLIIATVIVLVFFLILQSKRLDKIAFSIIVGGALGNFYDRIIFKAVPDFIDFHYNNFHWFTFNFADIFISVGVILYLLKNLIFKNE